MPKQMNIGISLFAKKNPVATTKKKRKKTNKLNYNNDTYIAQIRRCSKCVNARQRQTGTIHTQNNEKQSTSVDNSIDEVFLRRYTKIMV